jgi:glyoxylase-like metal-dependent hydrolase (beta-lactamase superfamily II)
MSLEAHDIGHVRANNPGPFSLTGTNTWLVGRDPCWIVDPGPLLDEHVEAVLTQAEGRGGVAGIALTHHHHDHADAVPAVVERTGARVVHGEDGGPLAAVPTPGHTADHFAYVAARVAFTGDAVLGEGSVFVTTQLGEYLDALRGLRDRDLALICPGHGPLVTEPSAKLEEYVEHRLDRERRLLDALGRGLRTVDELLDDVWDDAPDVLRAAATVTLGAHLEKLDAEGRLPDYVERPDVPEWLRAGKSGAF